MAVRVNALEENLDAQMLKKTNNVLIQFSESKDYEIEIKIKLTLEEINIFEKLNNEDFYKISFIFLNPENGESEHERNFIYAKEELINEK